MKYGRESKAGESDEDLYVEFLGIEIGQAPEYKGVIARVIKPTFGPMNADTFSTKHKIEF